MSGSLVNTVSRCSTDTPHSLGCLVHVHMSGAGTEVEPSGMTSADSSRLKTWNVLQASGGLAEQETSVVLYHLGHSKTGEEVACTGRNPETSESRSLWRVVMVQVMY